MLIIPAIDLVPIRVRLRQLEDDSYIRDPVATANLGQRGGDYTSI